MAATVGLSSPAGPVDRDVFAEGLLEFLRPAVGQLDTLCACLCRINEDQKVALDLDPYVKKLLNARRRVVLVNNILQNAQVFPVVLCESFTATKMMGIKRSSDAAFVSFSSL
uniref:Biogenesis of lysosome-related organelles complex 1 subunit 7 n=1 Tax=Laticauda laticaudata TaxID=8630 RepID=A0A8C5RF50_LATLA